MKRRGKVFLIFVILILILFILVYKYSHEPQDTSEQIVYRSLWIYMESKGDRYYSYTPQSESETLDDIIISLCEVVLEDMREPSDDRTFYFSEYKDIELYANTWNSVTWDNEQQGWLAYPEAKVKVCGAFSTLSDEEIEDDIFLFASYNDENGGLDSLFGRVCVQEDKGVYYISSCPDF